MFLQTYGGYVYLHEHFGFLILVNSDSKSFN